MFSPTLLVYICRPRRGYFEIKLVLLLVALSHAHEVLTREKWTGAHIVDVLQTILAPYEQSRLKLIGPSSWLPAKLSLPHAVHPRC